MSEDERLASEQSQAELAPKRVDGSRTWAAVNTHPHKEQLALEHLERQHFECYCPKIRKQVRHARRFREVVRPLFAGYIFVRVAAQRAHWRPIMSTIGVRSLVRFGDRPALVDDRFIETLRACDEDGVIISAGRLTRPPVPYEPGDIVRVSDGAFDGVVATILSVTGKDRLVILMDLLEQGVRAQISQDDVTPVSRGRAA